MSQSKSSKAECIVITGGSQGLGAELGRTFARQGYAVALIARNPEKLERARAEIAELAQTGACITAYSTDLEDEAATHRCFEEIRKQHGEIRALVNNAGTWMGTQAAIDATPDLLKKGLDLNFFTAVNATRAVLSARKGTRSDLAIVNIGATASTQGWPELATFCVSKAALRIYSQSLARELGPEGVHVAHVIVDGVLDNERTKGLNPDTSDEQFIKQSSVARSVLHLIEQDRSCWTFELDVRPFTEEW